MTAAPTYRQRCGGRTWGAYLRSRVAEEMQADVANGYALANLGFLRGDVLSMVRAERRRRQEARAWRLASSRGSVAGPALTSSHLRGLGSLHPRDVAELSLETALGLEVRK